MSWHVRTGELLRYVLAHSCRLSTIERLPGPVTTFMEPPTVLLFGDVVVDTSPALRKLYKAASSRPSLAHFLHRASSAIKAEYQCIPANERTGHEDFRDLPELAERHARQPNVLAATTILGVVQLGEYLVYIRMTRTPTKATIAKTSQARRRQAVHPQLCNKPGLPLWRLSRCAPRCCCLCSTRHQPDRIAGRGSIEDHSPAWRAPGASFPSCRR